MPKQKYDYINEEDKFWKHSYLVFIEEFGSRGMYVNADCEQDALDYAIDYAEEMGWEGLFLQDEDIQDMSEEELEWHICGGNHGRFLSWQEPTIKMLD